MIGSAMIHFIPKKEYGDFPHSHCLSSFPVDEVSCREGARGHVLNIAREYICVFNFEDETCQGNDTALMIAAAAAGCGILMPEREEGIASMRAAQDGLLKIDEENLRRIHEFESVRFITLGSNELVLKGQMVASVQIISGKTRDLQKIEKICHECRAVIDVLPLSGMGAEVG
jgi:hypothetical protein